MQHVDTYQPHMRPRLCWRATGIRSFMHGLGHVQPGAGLHVHLPVQTLGDMAAGQRPGHAERSGRT